MASMHSYLLSQHRWTSLSALDRCKSIEALESVDARLSNHLVEDLIRDHDPTVARFGLGLVPLAIEAPPLLEIAKGVDAATSDPKYQEELDLLVQLMN